ncbi:MAG: signal peptidase II [Thermomicrobiales bacterium]
MPATRDVALAGGLAMAVFIADRLSKAWVLEHLAPLQPPRIDLIGTWLSLEYAENRGIAFGLLGGLGPLIVLLPMAVAAAVAVLYLRSADPPVWQTVGVGLLAGGAAGNLLDRWRLGYVVDFIAVGWWPNFNMADSAITIGALTLIAGWMLLDGTRAHG